MRDYEPPLCSYTCLACGLYRRPHSGTVVKWFRGVVYASLAPKLISKLINLSIIYCIFRVALYVARLKHAAVKNSGQIKTQNIFSLR